jgi:parvulin-like peptidyl-prolyl isomerase
MANPQLLPPSTEEVVVYLRQELKLKEVYQSLWRQQIIQAFADDRGLTVSSEEIQEEADQIRHKNRLEKAEDTFKWLEENWATPDDWEMGIRHRLLRRKLANNMFESEVEKYFAQNRLNYDQFLLYQIVVDNRSLAQELFYQIEEREISFFEAASQYDINESRRYRCGFEGKIFRDNLKPDVAAAVLGTPVGEVSGPIEINQKYHLFLLKEYIPAELTEARNKEIVYKLFEEWLSTEMIYTLHNQ